MVDHLLDEVDADVRAEQIHQLWLRYRFKLLLVIVAVIIGTAGASIWQDYQEKRGGELFLQFQDAMTLYTAHKNVEAADGFANVASHTTGDVQTLAQLWQARALTAEDKKDEAIAVLKTASAGSADLWSDLACLRLASLDIDAAQDCLAVKKDSPLANQRREWHAATLWSQGKKDEAMALLEQLKTSPDTSDATRSLTDQWLATMRAEEPAK